MQRVVIFDFDGLLVDTEPLFFQAIKSVLGKEGIIVNEKDYIELDIQKGRPLLQKVKKENGALNVELVRQRIYKTYSKLLKKHRRQLFLPGARSLIDELEGFYLLTIASSSAKKFLIDILSVAGIINKFATIVSREDVQNLKPHPDCFLEVAKRLRVRQDDCVVIEDSRRGLEAAKKAHMRCIIIPNRYTDRYEYRDAQLVLNSLTQLNRKVIDKIFKIKSDVIIK